MSTGSFSFDEREFKRRVQRAVTEGIRTKAVPELQAKFDSVYRTHRGRPPEEVAARLLQVFPGDSGDRNTKSDVMQYAEAIAAGTRVRVKMGEIRW